MAENNSVEGARDTLGANGELHRIVQRSQAGSLLAEVDDDFLSLAGALLRCLCFPLPLQLAHECIPNKLARTPSDGLLGSYAAAPSVPLARVGRLRRTLSC